MSNIIWDFDGTLVDSLPLATDLFYQFSKREPFTPKEIEAMRNMTLKEVLQRVNVPLWRLPKLLVQGRAAIGKRLNEVPLFEGIEPVLRQLHQSSHGMVVMSSNSSDNIRRFLKAKNIDKYFIGQHGNTGIFSKTKAMKMILRKYHWIAAETYAIGDETRDIDAANKTHINSVAVSWGYNGSKILKTHKPDFLAAKPTDILKLIQ